MKKNKNKLVKYYTSMTAAILALSLTMTGCSNDRKNDKFYIYQNIYGQLELTKPDYIEHQYIGKYYVIEVYYPGLQRNQLYIAFKYDFYDSKTKEITYSRYTNIFNNYTIAYSNNKQNGFQILKVTPLIDYLTEYNLINDKYSYKDMQEIYDIIEENYKYQDNGILTKKLVIDNKM